MGTSLHCCRVGIGTEVVDGALVIFLRTTQKLKTNRLNHFKNLQQR